MKAISILVEKISPTDVTVASCFPAKAYTSDPGIIPSEVVQIKVRGGMEVRPAKKLIRKWPSDKAGAQLAPWNLNLQRRVLK